MAFWFNTFCQYLIFNLYILHSCVACAVWVSEKVLTPQWLLQLADAAAAAVSSSVTCRQYLFGVALNTDDWRGSYHMVLWNKSD